MLRIIVIALLVANILLFAMKFMQPDADDAGPVESNSPTEPTSPKNAPQPEIEPVEDESPEDGLGNLQVSEEPDDTAPESEAELESMAEPQSGAAMAVADVINCVRLGPFESESQMASLRTELQNSFNRVQPRETKSIVDKGFWVLLPPYSTRAEVEKTVDQLSEAGVGDTYIVPNGESANAVSLGIYARRERAEQRRGEINARLPGLNIVVELRTEIQSQYWLDAGPVDALDPALIQLSVGHPDVNQLQIGCPGAGFEQHAADTRNNSPSEAGAGDEKAPEN